MEWYLKDYYEFQRRWYKTDIEIQILHLAKHIKICKIKNWRNQKVGKPIESRCVGIPYQRLFCVSY